MFLNILITQNPHVSYLSSRSVYSVVLMLSSSMTFSISGSIIYELTGESRWDITILYMTMNGTNVIAEAIIISGMNIHPREERYVHVVNIWIRLRIEKGRAIQQRSWKVRPRITPPVIPPSKTKKAGSSIGSFPNIP